MKLAFASDYMEGAHQAIMDRLVSTNMEHTSGYGTDEHCERARSLIREACNTPDADVFFVSGGTQTNALMIDSILRPYQGVIAADTGHISSHEAGAIEHGGHKVLTVSHRDGKITADDVERCVAAYRDDENHDHMVMPGMVYISQPTEYGTLYNKAELESISRVCRANGLILYLDGARLAYALTQKCEANDVTLSDIGRLCDAFYIGGTKCGALFGEAIVIPRHDMIPHLFTMIKQHGALLAKGRIMGIQFEVLFEDALYQRIADTALEYAKMIKSALKEKGYKFAIDSPTNQIFVVFDNDKLSVVDAKVSMGFWEKIDDDHTVMRLATSWATSLEDTRALIELL